MVRGRAREIPRPAGAKSQEPKAKSQKPKAKSQKPKAKSQKPKAKSSVHSQLVAHSSQLRLQLPHWAESSGLYRRLNEGMRFGDW
jgi:hypothetical protein